MIKPALYLLAIICFGYQVQAQNLRFGVKGGVNFSKITGKDAATLSGKTGFNGGLVSLLDLSDKFGVQPELLYSGQQGGEDPDGQSYTMDYLTLPVLFAYKPANNISIHLGPQIAYNVRKSKDFTKLNAFDFGGALGAQVEFSKFFAQARYIMGFTKLFEQTDAKNSVFQLSVGYWFW